MAERLTDQKTSPLLLLSIFTFFFAAYALTLEGLPTGGDAWGMFLVTDSIVNDGDVFLSASDRVVLRAGRDGKWVSKYGIGQSLAEIPAYLAGSLASKSAHGPYRTALLYFITSFTSVLVSSGTCVLFYLTCVQIGWSRRVSLVLTVAVGFGSLIWPYSKTLFSEPLQAFSLPASFYMLMKWRDTGGAWRAAAAGFFLGLTAATKPFLVLCTPPLIVYFLCGLGLRRRGKAQFRDALLFFCAFAFWIAVVICYNWLRFGNPLELGYLGGTDRDGVHGFNTPLLVGLHGLLFSSGKGLIFFMPATVLLIFAWRPFARRRPAEAWTIAAVSVLMLVSYSKWNAWHGDYSWGPRFLLPAVPLLLLPIGVLFRRFANKAAVISVFCISVFVQVLGVSVNHSEFILAANGSAPYNVFFHPGRIELRDNLLATHYIPEYSQIAGHYWMLKHIASRGSTPLKESESRMQKDFPWRGIARRSVPVATEAGLTLDTWWAYFPKLFPKSSAWVYPTAWIFVIILFISAGSLALTANKTKDDCADG